jgi:hypothetical protein
MGYEIWIWVWVMGFNRVMGFPCERSWWMPKSMGYYRLWVVTEMGYDRVDCNVNALGLALTKLKPFRERQEYVFKVLGGIGS